MKRWADARKKIIHVQLMFERDLQRRDYVTFENAKMEDERQTQRGTWGFAVLRC